MQAKATAQQETTIAQQARASLLIGMVYGSHNGCMIALFLREQDALEQMRVACGTTLLHLLQASGIQYLVGE